MLSRLWSDLLREAPELVAIAILLLVALAIVLGVVIDEVRIARSWKLASDAEAKRDTETPARRRRLKVLQGRLGLRRSA